MLHIVVVVVVVVVKSDNSLNGRSSRKSVFGRVVQV